MSVIKKFSNKKTPSIKVNAILSVAKQICAIVFPMITFPYATRILGVENYGKINFSSSIVEYVSLIAAAGISRYAIRECARVRDDKDKLTNVINELFSINIVSTIIAYVFLIILFMAWPKLRNYTSIILVQTLSVIFTTLGTDWVNSAMEDYFFITVRYIICQVIAIIMMFILVRSKSDYVAYALTGVIGTVLANLMNIFHIRRELGIIPRFIVSKGVLKRVKPVVYMFICSIASTIYINSDITILNIFTNDKVVGYYSVSTRFYNMVKQIVNAAFIVVIPRISNFIAIDNATEEGASNLASNKLSELLNITILFAFPLAVGLFMISKNLILLFSGNAYLPATSSLKILAIAIIPATMANFYVNIVMIPYMMDKKVMIETVISALVNIILNVFLIPYFKADAAAFTTLIAEFTMVIMGIIYTRNTIQTKIIKPLLTTIVGCTFIMLICKCVNTFVMNSFINICLCVIASGLIYAVVIMIVYKNEVYSLLKRG